MIERKRTHLRCRPITDSDRPSIAALLTRGFPERPQSYWTHALDTLAHRNSPEGYPRYGYLLERKDDAPIGVILTIFRQMEDNSIRCNLSSWHTTEAFRAYASLLVAAALRHKEVVYINVSPAPHTWPVIQAQGFKRYCDGQMLTLPALSRASHPARIISFEERRERELTLTPAESALMREHVERYGCIGLIARDEKTDRPFLFLRKKILGFVPTLQLVYCRDIDDFPRYAAPLGRALLRRGHASVLIDANASYPSLPGYYFSDRGPKYFKGPNPPRLGDLAFTESVLFGA